MSLMQEFPFRHIGPNDEQVNVMLDELALETVEDLINRAVPSNIRERSTEIRLPDALSETGAISRLREIAAKNTVLTSLIGMGYYNSYTPSVIQRNILENPSWYTAYTPYQSEISQGRLEALLNYQTMISDLTGCDIANASLLDEATAAAEAMTMLKRLHKGVKNTFVLDSECLPQTISVVKTRADAMGIDIKVGDPSDPGEDCFGVLYQYPGSSGEIRPLTDDVTTHHGEGRLVAVAADLLALCLLTPPGECGADVVVGNAQRFGVPLGFGGPHAGYIATKHEYRRSLPGRIVGVSVDTHGNTALRLALQTREQHIRRERATSNICTAQVLLAVIAGSYAVYHGPEGLRNIAHKVHVLTNSLVANLRSAEFEVTNSNWFDTVTVRTSGEAQKVVRKALTYGINLRYVDKDTIGISFDETTTRDILEKVLRSFEIQDFQHEMPSPISANLKRQSKFCEHPVFNSYQTETEMLRYLRKLSDKDLALDRSMIPLGSCTMKLNASTEMLPVTWPEFSDIHPFVPAEQREGYDLLIDELQRWLAMITGYDAVSLQPNAGSQGELAGLLAIRSYHRSNEEFTRNICLIPASAHGTNAASAAMAGMEVVVIECDDDGNIDMNDLEQKCVTHAQRLSAIMVTYPSTHGVFEESIIEICELIHMNGGQVYLDGANLNALVGIAQPGKFGADVSHLNLHKTFCIPHGGGGPGVGPVVVAKHLKPYLPNHPVIDDAGPESGVGPISAAPWGSAGILPISWAYIAMMGEAGLANATKIAILNANYIASRLSPHYPILFTGEKGYVAHECIIDIRPITQTSGVTVDDIAKRLMDYGFHAPTMSFPVPGTLMIEPTESEALREINRFCDAMINIRKEIDNIEAGNTLYSESMLHNAPHTALHLTKEVWNHPYTREEAGYPDVTLKEAKYWPPVGRIDGVHGDKNLICSCPSIDDYR
ncbi:MAG: aminomethyl-transferring glycine dehydrogenase [Acidimicrobiales bacterium]|nr:aminomethyl-transferring glycine dehydrogenase [Acidimicrobiales bacterium]